MDKNTKPNEINNNITKITDEYVISLLDKNKIKSPTYFDIFLFNCLEEYPTSNTDDLVNTYQITIYPPSSFNNKAIYLNMDKLDKSIDNITEYHDSLLSICMVVSSFQFIGLFLQNNKEIIDLHIKFAYFMLSIGFLFSMFGVLVTYLISQYLKSIKLEPVEFIIVGINTYKKWFKIAQILIFLNFACFVIPLNILIYPNIGLRFGIIYNLISFCLFIVGIGYYYNIVMAPQKYKSNSCLYKRKIY